MKIGMIVAIDSELKAFLDKNYEPQMIEQDHRTIYTAAIGDNELYAVRSGAGIIDAATATQYLITKFGVNVILNFGVTGALHTGPQVNELFVVDKVCHYEYDTSPIDPVVKFQYPEYPDKYMRTDEALIKLALSVDPELKTAKDASGSLFVEDREVKDRLFRETDCDLCEMESAAIVRTCLQNEVPCLLIKCISDNYEGNGGDFATNVGTSAERAFTLLDKIIKKL